MTKINKIIIIVVAILMAGCVTEKRCAKKFKPSTDSIYIEKIKEVYRDTTIFVELPPLEIKTFVQITDTIELKGNYSTARAWVDSANLVGELKEGEKPVKIEYKIKEVEVIKIKAVREIERVKFVPKFTQWLSWVGVIALILIVIKVLLRFLK